MISLVDTSVWIDLMRGTAPPELKQEVEGLLASAQTAMCPPVWLELFRGVRGKRELEFITQLRGVSRWMPVTDEGWEEASQLSQDAVRRGLSCPLADILIFACARHHDLKLVHRDKHLDALEKG